jgi:hypothetical protein
LADAKRFLSPRSQSLAAEFGCLLRGLGGRRRALIWGIYDDMVSTSISDRTATPHFRHGVVRLHLC